MLEGLEIVMSALQGVTAYAAIVAGLYLFIELLKIAVMYGAPVVAITYLCKAWVQRHSEPIVTITRKELKLGPICITSDGTDKDLEDFLVNDVMGSDYFNDSYIHSHRVEQLRQAWRHYIRLHKQSETSKYDNIARKRLNADLADAAAALTVSRTSSCT